MQYQCIVSSVTNHHSPVSVSEAAVGESAL